MKYFLKRSHTRSPFIIYHNYLLLSFSIIFFLFYFVRSFVTHPTVNLLPFLFVKPHTSYISHVKSLIAFPCPKFVLYQSYILTNKNYLSLLRNRSNNTTRQFSTFNVFARHDSDRRLTFAKINWRHDTTRHDTIL